MKKTNYSFMVSSSYVKSTWRKVYEENGKYFVKYNNQWIDVTDKKDKFVED